MSRRDPWFWQRWAHEQRVGHPIRKLILSDIAVRAEVASGCCFASQSDLAFAAECSDRSVRTHLKALEEAGLLRRVKRSRPDGGTAPDGFQLLADPAEPDAATPRNELVPEGAERAASDELPKNDSSSPAEKKRAGEEPIGFAAWLGHHHEASGGTVSVPRAGTRVRAAVAASYRARLDEGYSDEDLRLASLGVFADEWMVANGHTQPLTVLRPERVQKWIDAGRRAAARAGTRGKYDHLDGEL